MERGKSSSGRGSKSKTPQFPADLYALGSKSSNEPKPRSGTHPGPKAPIGTSSSDRDRKRDGPTLPSAVPSKKSKISSSLLPRQGITNSGGSSSSSSSSSIDTWESLAQEVDTPELVPNVMEAIENEEQDKCIGLICGAIKLLRGQRFKTDPILFMSLAYLTKVKKQLFTNECVVAGLGSLLKRDPINSTFKNLPPKINIVTSLLAVNILTKSFQDVKKWPESLLKVYLEDAGGERNWVDHELAKNFVENIIFSLSTKHSTVMLPDPTGRPEQQEDDLVTTLKMGLTENDLVEVVPPSARFRWNKDAVELIALETVKEQLTKRQSIDLINRNFLRMLSSLCGVSEVRVLIAPRVEAWIQNPKLMRSAQELLMSLCVNCCAHTIKDVEVISSLIKMRLKTKALSNYYLSCIRELVLAHPDNLGTVLKHTIYNELSSSRNPNNMPMLSVIFQCDANAAADHLADIFLELLMNRDDYLRPLRALLRELARVLRHELKLQNFCRGLMSHTEPLARDVDNIKAFTSTVDIISLCVFLAVMPYARTEKKDMSQIEKMQTTISTIQTDAVWWLQETALSIYKPTPTEFVHAIHKVLLLEPAEQYYKTDNWPPEQDRVLFMRMASEVPVYETTIITLLVVGLSKDHPLSPSEALDLTLEITKRAAAVHNPIIPVLKTDKIKILDLVFNLSAYRHPENIDLPVGYKPPSLAISTLYWKGWTLLLVLSSHNPAKFGALAWDKYPTLRVLMEMCITSHFVFPPGFDDLQMLTVEKQLILEFETHLAAASTKMEITEQTSLLLSQLVTMDPFGPPRRPPPATVEIIKAMNTPLRLGHLLCRSRQPDFLLDIIHRQGASQSMPWLADLVHNSEGALNHLPVQCLCEFLLSSGHKQEGKYHQLLRHLQNILIDPNQDPLNACEVLDYFLRRLSSPNNRSLAISGLKLVISPLVHDEKMDVDKEKNAPNKEDSSWLMNHLPMLPHFDAARSQIVSSLRTACQVENEPNLVTAYLCFLAKHATGDLNEMGELVLDMAQLIVERSTIMASILPAGEKPNSALDAFLLIFYNYLTKAREPKKDKYTWSESQDQVLVTWSSGEECTVHILVVHAMVILLTYGPEAVTVTTQYYHLLDTWFPRDVSRSPKGFLVDTSEEALLIPDWLKLRMIRSHVPRLVKAALTDLDMAQLILFIQSFGIPIASMSQLLTTLDNAVINDQNSVGDAVIDKAYMIQLVEVQHRRGATGGETFTRVLDLQDTQKVQSMDCDAVVFKKETSSKTPRIQQSYLSEEEGVSVLEKLFGDMSDAYSSKNHRILFTNFQKTLVHEISSRDGCVSRGPFVSTVINFLHTSVVSRPNRGFINQIFSRPQYSCPLFRLLATIAPNSTTLTQIANVILERKTDNPRIKALLAILKQYLSKQNSTEMEVSVIKEEMETDLEETSLINTMNQLLVCPDEEAGYLVDKLVKLEPEILGSEMEIQMKLLFCKRKVGTLKCRPYLLTLLTHHASWRTLSQCVDILLKKDSVAQYESTPVLDFLKALTCNPKLWQGREKHTPKHYKPEDVLNLDLEQLKILTDYIVAEAVSIEEGNVDVLLGKKDMSHYLSQRLSLLNLCISATNIRFATDIAKYLIDKSSRHLDQSIEVKMSKQLLIHLYLKIPSLITNLSKLDIQNSLIKLSSLSIGGCCTMDVMSHNLITALSETSSLKDWTKKSQELELLLRKMASTHPLLVLRQLPLIASVLRGRVDLDWNVFRFRGHWLFFQQIANLIDLLRPTIYHNHYATSLHKILNTYLELFQNYVRESGMIEPLLMQFVVFMQGYINYNVEQVNIYLQKHAEELSDLQEDYPLLRIFCVIIPGLKGGKDVIVTPKSIYDAPSIQWDTRLSQLNKDDPCSILQFIEYNSSKKPALLGPIFPTLCSHLKSSSSQVRTVAHTVVMRYLKHNPKSAAEAVPCYLSCLDSSNPEIVLSSLDKIPELVVCSQELGAPILKKIFNLGVSNNVNTSSCISKTIALLNLQSAC